MPRQETGPVKFGVEHDIRPDKKGEKLSAEKLRQKAEHYTDKTDT